MALMAPPAAAPCAREGRVVCTAVSPPRKGLVWWGGQSHPCFSEQILAPSQGTTEMRFRVALGTELGGGHHHQDITQVTSTASPRVIFLGVHSTRAEPLDLCGDTGPLPPTPEPAELG